MPSDEWEFAFSLRVFHKAPKIKALINYGIISLPIVNQRKGGMPSPASTGLSRGPGRPRLHTLIAGLKLPYLMSINHSQSEGTWTTCQNFGLLVIRCKAMTRMIDDTEGAPTRTAILGRAKSSCSPTGMSGISPRFSNEKYVTATKIIARIDAVPRIAMIGALCQLAIILSGRQKIEVFARIRYSDSINHNLQSGHHTTEEYL